MVRWIASLVMVLVVGAVAGAQVPETVTLTATTLEELMPAQAEHAIDLLTVMVKIAAVLGVLAVLGFLLARIVGKRFGTLTSQAGDLIRVIDVKRLDPRTALYLVEVEGSFVLVSVSDRDVRALSANLDNVRISQALASRGGKATAFASLVKRPASKETES